MDGPIVTTPSVGVNAVDGDEVELDGAGVVRRFAHPDGVEQGFFELRIREGQGGPWVARRDRRMAISNLSWPMDAKLKENWFLKIQRRW